MALTKKAKGFYMELVSKTRVLDALESRRVYYNDTTEIGRAMRESIAKAIHDIEDAFPRDLFTLEYLGESDLSDLITEATKKRDTLTEEPVIKVFMIKGVYEHRYTQCHEKAKEILKEELIVMIDNITVDYADAKMDIQTKEIKASNLKDYKIE